MKIFGLIGHPLSHSFSKSYFEKKFESQHLNDCEYRLFDLKTIDEIKTLRQEYPGLAGLNVTIPYKQSVIPYLDGLSEKAKIAGAVNTIKFKHGKWFGYNSDIFGFSQSLIPLLSKEKNAALILGTGGASLAVKFVLEALGIPYLMVSRQTKTSCISYDELNESVLLNYNLIINTTPLGMFPGVDEMPGIPFQFINPTHIFYDLIYNPEETLLLKTAKEKGCIVKNGLEMLYLQAEKSWEMWNE